MSTVDKIERAVAPVVESSDLELVDVEFESRIVRVTVDREGGVDLESIGRLTSAVSRALDDADAVPGERYELEVSSPGLERRLRRPHHYMSRIGTELSVKTKPGVEGDRRLEGRLASADERGIRIELGDGSIRQLAYDDVDRATTVFDWRAALSAANARTKGDAE